MPPIPESMRTSLSAEDLKSRYSLLTKNKMWGWYDVFSLLETARDVLLSGFLVRRLDFRILETVGTRGLSGKGRDNTSAESAVSTSPEDEISPEDDIFFEYKLKENESDLWFDYVADVGDGFNSTFRVASLLARPELEVLGMDDEKLQLRRGRFLIFGGDQVYPSASRAHYEQRFVRLYEAAAFSPRSPNPHTAPHIYAIPGNHDWYDGLASFMEIFGAHRSLGQWRTRQRRSYFALKLPHHFWIFAIDIGLSGELDEQQVAYFQMLRRVHLEKGDRIILCLAEPEWVKQRPVVPNLRDGLFYFERKLSEASKASKAKDDVYVVLRLAGDLHHYRRHVSCEPVAYPTDSELQKNEGAGDRENRTVQNITSGGGGAFLHPTHELTSKLEEMAADTKETQLGVTRSAPGVGNVIFQFQKAFPTLKESRRLARQNWGFPFWNGKMWLVLAVLYTGVLGTIAHLITVGQYVWAVLTFLLITMPIWFGCHRFASYGSSGVVGEGKQGRERFVRQTGTQSWYWVVHALFHTLLLVGATLSLGWGGVSLLGSGNPACSPSPAWVQPVLLFVTIATGVVTALLSLLAFGAYLVASLNWHNDHANEAFSSLRIERFKNFLRLKVDAKGVTVYPIGLKDVPTAWTFTEGQLPEEGAPLFVPNHEAESQRPRLIEHPIEIECPR